MNTRLAIRALTLSAALSAASLAQAATVNVFSSGFESGLSAWVDRYPASPDAAVFDDPLRPGNHVLGFNRTVGGGSLFSTAAVSSSGSYTLSFDYLGRPGLGGVAGDLGGFIGVSSGLFGSSEMWLAGTRSFPGLQVDLLDDGLWHSYSITFTSTIGSLLHVKAEDFDGSGGVAGDAFFDNVVLRDSSVAAPVVALGQAVPEPTSLALVALALLCTGLGAARGRSGR
jgi:hypothetical protein